MVQLENSMMVPKKLKMKAPYVPAIPFLSIYLEKTKALIQKDTCMRKFTAALFTAGGRGSIQVPVDR